MGVHLSSTIFFASDPSNHIIQGKRKNKARKRNSKKKTPLKHSLRVWYVHDLFMLQPQKLSIWFSTACLVHISKDPQSEWDSLRLSLVLLWFLPWDVWQCFSQIEQRRLHSPLNHPLISDSNSSTHFRVHSPFLSPISWCTKMSLVNAYNIKMKIKNKTLVEIFWKFVA